MSKIPTGQEEVGHLPSKSSNPVGRGPGSDATSSDPAGVTGDPKGMGSGWTEKGSSSPMPRSKGTLPTSESINGHVNTGADRGSTPSMKRTDLVHDAGESY
jgi:hypothetical protein